VIRFLNSLHESLLWAATAVGMSIEVGDAIRHAAVIDADRIVDDKFKAFRLSVVNSEPRPLFKVSIRIIWTEDKRGFTLAKMGCC
jgi:hypothetical protein